MIREYIAVVVMNRKRHSIVVGTILGFSIILTALNFSLIKLQKRLEILVCPDGTLSIAVIPNKDAEIY